MGNFLLTSQVLLTRQITAQDSIVSDSERCGTSSETGRISVREEASHGGARTTACVPARAGTDSRGDADRDAQPYHIGGSSSMSPCCGWRFRLSHRALPHHPGGRAWDPGPQRAARTPVRRHRTTSTSSLLFRLRNSARTGSIHRRPPAPCPSSQNLCRRSMPARAPTQTAHSDARRMRPAGRAIAVLPTTRKNGPTTLNRHLSGDAQPLMPCSRDRAGVMTIKFPDGGGGMATVRSLPASLRSDRARAAIPHILSGWWTRTIGHVCCSARPSWCCSASASPT